MLTLDELLAVPGAQLQSGPNSQQFSGIAYDSRLAQAGELFLALRTERGDGHRYIDAALAAGCAGVLCSVPPAVVPDAASIVVVPDVLTAIQEWAAMRLRRVAPTVIAVTGSVGKTSTTRAVAALLEGLAPTFRSRRSFNSLLGLPVTLAMLALHHRLAVLEMGVDRFGEMARLTELFPPQVAVVTNIGAVHLECFGSLEGVAQEKALVLEALPDHGCAVLNADDPLVRAMAGRTRARVLTFGIKAPDADLRASAIMTSLGGTSFTVCYRQQTIPARIGLTGAHSVVVALAALGAALACGMSLEAAVARLPLLSPAQGRLQPLPAVAGATLLDDTYNASPPALEAALHTLTALPARRRVAVLGDMHGLGAQAEALHRQAGQAALALDRLVTCGDLAAFIAEGARAAGLAPERISVTHTAREALAATRAGLGPSDLVLVKGSEAARMERVAAGLLAEGTQPQHLLVRQEPAWETVRVAEPGRPTWLEIDLDAIAGNTRQLRLLAGPKVEVMAVLKADAYGHGALRVARTALANGATSLAVATLSEARVLREGGVAAPILVLGYTPPWQAHEALALEVACTVYDLDCAHALDAAAAALRRPAFVHLKVDTGMSRLGVFPDEALALLRTLHELPGLRVEGIYTHLARADEADPTPSLAQLARFDTVLNAIRAAGLPLPRAHAANSAGLLRYPQARYDIVRPGCALYGLAPGPDTPLPAAFRPALSFKTRIARVATLPPDTPVGYGATYVTPDERRIATIPVGYADGFRRTPCWREVLVRGQRAPLVGRVCMDYTMIDVSAVAEARVGDEVVLLGHQLNDTIGAAQVADWLGTNSYEVVSAILSRVPRIQP